MLRKAVVVVGSGWGDEGKGSLTDYLAMPESLVCRFSGGSQAGHTVVRNGARHVFHHVGSGTLRGAHTLLSRFFISNPIVFMTELADLRSIGMEPVVYADAAGMVTTPWDMMINQIVEEARGVDRHGSCGLGINETMQRHQHYPFTVDDLNPPNRLTEHLRPIMTDWVPFRLRQLGLDPSDYWIERLRSTDILTTFEDFCSEFSKVVHTAPADVLQRYPHVVFEGAQGLLLDQDHRFFPHVTHAHTGLHNVARLADGFEQLDVVYVTRAYATRHGAGPFPHEDPTMRHADPTNLPNLWQGSLRFGQLSLDLLAESLAGDARHLHVPMRRGLAVTCLDQMGDRVAFWQHGEPQIANRQHFLAQAFATVDADIRLIGQGPSAADISVWTD